MDVFDDRVEQALGTIDKARNVKPDFLDVCRGWILFDEQE